MIIRRSTEEDLPGLMEIYREARQIQLDSGNLHQWKKGTIHLLNGDPRLAYQKTLL